MPEIKLEHVTKRWGKFYGVDDLSMVIEDNAFVTLLGPSGCGKTTTLRMIAGLETPTEGRISIGGNVVFDSSMGINVPANKRKVGFLFQNYALWPNMTVYQNISFGLSNIKEEMASYSEIGRRNKRLLEILKNPSLLEGLTKFEKKDEEKKVLITLTETYGISMDSAKKLLSVLAKDNPEELLSSEIEEERKKAAEKGLSFDDDFNFIKDGKIEKTVRKLTKDEIDLSVRKVSKLVRIGMFMDRYPAELSGGQQQRVAIARTLAPEPSVLFMDEPLSNLDAKLRLDMRYELQRLHFETGGTFVYVTHDQMEAMTLATKICLMSNALLKQYAPPLEVYKRPTNIFAADFVGNPSINFIDAKGKEENGEVKVKIFSSLDACFTLEEPVSIKEWRDERDKAENEEKVLAEKKKNEKGYVEKSNKDEMFKYRIDLVNQIDDSLEKVREITDEDFILGVRPENVVIGEEGDIDGEIYGAMPTGMESTIKVRIGDFLLTSVVFGSISYPIGKKVKVSFPGKSTMLFDRKSGKLITLGSLKF